MKQSKIESLIEMFFNQGIGILTSFLTWVYIIIPLFNIPYQGFFKNITITLIFTTISIFRGFIVRRFFNAGINRQIHEFVKHYVKK